VSGTVSVSKDENQTVVLTPIPALLISVDLNRNDPEKTIPLVVAAVQRVVDIAIADEAEFDGTYALLRFDRSKDDVKLHVKGIAEISKNGVLIDFHGDKTELQVKVYIPHDHDEIADMLKEAGAIFSSPENNCVLERKNGILYMNPVPEELQAEEEESEIDIAMAASGVDSTNSTNVTTTTEPQKSHSMKKTLAGIAATAAGLLML
jgi:hypothetical protein